MVVGEFSEACLRGRLKACRLQERNVGTAEQVRSYDLDRSDVT
jgi:hypothetical protein